MKWQGRQQSGNVENRVGSGGKLAAGGSLGIVFMLIMAFMTGDPSELINSILNGNQSQTQHASLTETEVNEMTEFVSVVLYDTEVVWTQIFKEEGLTYNKPGLVLYSDTSSSGCGTASAQMGPFYCPSDQKIYIDLIFYKQLSTAYKAPGDFAMAYVLAHEVGHHVQNELGILTEVQNLMSRSSQTKANDLSVRLELQADYLAGVFANYIQGQGLLDEGDFEEALQAAYAVGDDTLQKQYQGRVIPENFTHGSAKQRMDWFSKGFETGDLSQGNTFASDALSSLNSLRLVLSMQ